MQNGLKLICYFIIKMKVYSWVNNKVILKYWNSNLHTIFPAQVERGWKACMPGQYSDDAVCMAVS